MVVIKVILSTITHARDLVSIAERTPCDVNLHCNRFVVNAKSILGVLSLPFENQAQLQLKTNDPTIINAVVSKLDCYNLLLVDDVADLNKAYDISAFGEILIDFTNQGVNDTNQKIFVRNPGGAPANVLVAATKMGSKTAFLGKVGDDMHGVFLQETLKQQDLNIDGLILDPNHFTTLAFVDLDEFGERTFSFARKPGADTQLTIDELNTDVLKNSRIFHVGSLSLTTNPSRETTFHAIKCAKHHGALISYDPNYRASLWPTEQIAKEHMRSLIPYVDIMKISDSEIELLTDKKTYEEAAKDLCSQGVKIVVVTLGDKGAYVCTTLNGQLVQGFSSQVVDTTGAGDAFWGGFLHGIAHSNLALESLQLSDLVHYARIANAVASLCVEGLGAIPSMPDLETISLRLNDFE